MTWTNDEHDPWTPEPGESVEVCREESFQYSKEVGTFHRMEGEFYIVCISGRYGAYEHIRPAELLCYTCDAIKPLNSFGNHKANLFKKSYICKECKGK